MCHSRYRSYDAPVPDHRTVVGDPPDDDVRASDDERERAVTALRGHAHAGRLDAAELEERLGRALGAITRGELAALFSDLPDARRPRAEVPARRRSHRREPLAYLPLVLLLVAIWAVTGAGYFWPIWPLLWFAFASMGGFRRGNRSVIR
jgi:hypothetical protein